MKTWIARFLVLIPVLTFAAPAAHAQWAVIDVASVDQLIQEVTTLKAALTTAEGQLAEARSAYAAITGNRGMSELLSGIDRNYLPGDWSEIQGVLSGSPGPYGALATSLDGLVASNAVLSPAEVATLSPSEQSALSATRNSTALLQAMTREALATTSARFATLQELIDAISRATDEKGILDLQARISAEATMLQNDQTKLGVLYQVARSEREVNAERTEEEAIVGIGSFRDLPPLAYRPE
jgi:hypothetical protein